MRNSGPGIFASLRRRRRAVVLALALGALAVLDPRAPSAWAGGFAVSGTDCLAFTDGTLSCANGLTAASVIPDKAVVIGSGGAREVGNVAVNATATKKYLQQTSSGTPTFDQIAIGDLASISSANLVTAVSDETGSASGSPLLVFNQNPTFAGITATGTLDFTGATVNLPADAVDAMTEIKSTIKTGTGTNKLATFEGTATAGKCAQINANGNIEAAAAACGASSAGTIVHIDSVGPISNGATTVYMSLTGQLSTTSTATAAQSVLDAKAYSLLRCTADSNSVGMTVTMATGTCGAALSNTTLVTPTMTTGNTVYADTTHTTSASTAGQCGQLVVAKTSATANFTLHCVMTES